MRGYLKLFIMLAALCAVLPGAPAWAQIDGVKAYKVGDVTVWAVADAISERDLGVFPAATPEITAQYTPTGKAASAIMTYVIQHDKKIILVDTGLGGPASTMLQGLASLGIKPADVSHVLLTHYHGDHIGGLISNGAKVFPNAKIYSAKMEHDYWLSYANMQANPDRRSGFELARQIFRLYEDADVVFEFDDTVLPGITALNAVGHTPGHTVFLLESQGQKLLFWADLVHAAVLQFPRPDINATFDMNPIQAAAARERFMALAAKENLPIAGAHLPFAGIGLVKVNPAGGYLYQPLSGPDE